MIMQDQILPSLYRLQREGAIGNITVCDRRSESIDKLRDDANIRSAFPERQFTGTTGSFEAVLANAKPRGIAVVAVPDQLHYEVVTAALDAAQHVLCVKPLVLRVRESLEIEEKARGRGLLVGIEYHKRFDDRSLMARRKYRDGLFGEFKLGTARLMEKWYYRNSNFQNWCTAENSDAFTYIGCHYVDLVHFITGLLPASVSVYGIRDRYPNGNEGFLWTDARVIWQNGACLNIQNSLSFPDDAPGTNTQGMTMYCAGDGRGGLLDHSDQYRGLSYAYIRDPAGAGATAYSEPSPDYFQYVDLGGVGLTPVGYGVRSVEHIVRAACRVESGADLAARQALLDRIDSEGIIATPANSRHNELVTEAGRLSILNNAQKAVIDYERLEVRLA
jgi:predicted dehydrogenase